MSRAALNAWIDCVKLARPGLLATVLQAESKDVEAGSRLFVSEDGDRCGSLGSRVLDDAVVEKAREKWLQIDPKSEAHPFALHGKDVTVFLDVHVPSPEVMIFGAGHDAIPVASFAQQSGFRVTVVDQREAFATAKRFPGAHIVLTRPEHLEDRVRPDRRTFVVIMNHHLDRDRACLRFALESDAPYVGLLGPRKRCERLLQSLREEGVTFTEKELSRLYNPVGLDLGAEGSDEIAVSIVSEMIAVKHGKSGRHLRAQRDSAPLYQSAEKR